MRGTSSASRVDQLRACQTGVRVALTVRELITLGTELDGDYIHASDVYCTRPSLVHIEGYVHELAHLAVFNTHPRYAPDGSLGVMVGELFDDYETYWASDRSEFKAVAVELLVARGVGLPIDVDSLMGSVGRGCRYYAPTNVPGLVHAYMERPLTQRRARRVLRWLAPYINQAKYTLRIRADVRRQKRAIKEKHD